MQYMQVFMCADRTATVNLEKCPINAEAYFSSRGVKCDVCMMFKTDVYVVDLSLVSIKTP